MSIDITTLALAKEYTNRMVGSGGTGGGVNGKDGITPHIGDNGNWFIGTVDTGVSAQGPAGENGVTPHIGTNGNWYIGSVNTGVSAKGVKGDNGLDGNGIKSAILNSDYTLTLTFDDGTTYTTPSIRGEAGAPGSAGKDGADGVGIASIKQTTTSTADGGNNVFTVTLTNGTTATFTVKNGSKGSTGEDGSNGVDGGHYTPVVTQPTTDTMQISFAPSKSDMPAVNPVTVNLPVSENSGQNVNWMYVTVEIEDEIPCTGITLDKSALNFTGAGQQAIVATVTPADTTDTLVWTSSKPAVAAVAGGVVTAYANGSATITATCGGYSATCAVEVSGISNTVAVTGITLDKATATVQAGSAITLTATVKPDNATNKTVLWSSDDETVAKVVDGVVTGISEGTASIGAMTADGGFSAVCNVTVAAASNYRNLFDKDTMTTANQGINGQGTIGSYNWGLARVPVKENTTYSIKMVEDHGGVEDATKEPAFYNGATAGAFGFADDTGNTVLSRLSFAHRQSIVDAGTNGVNALLHDYAHSDKVDKGYVGWVTFTTPAGCAYLLFNTTIKNNADKIQLEEGDTIHNYYLPYNGGAA